MTLSLMSPRSALSSSGCTMLVMNTSPCSLTDPSESSLPSLRALIEPAPAARKWRLCAAARSLAVLGELQASRLQLSLCLAQCSVCFSWWVTVEAQPERAQGTPGASHGSTCTTSRAMVILGEYPARLHSTPFIVHQATRGMVKSLTAMLVILLHLAQLVWRWRMNWTASASLPQRSPQARIPAFLVVAVLFPAGF